MKMWTMITLLIFANMVAEVVSAPRDTDTSGESTMIMNYGKVFGFCRKLTKNNSSMWLVTVITTLTTVAAGQQLLLNALKILEKMRQPKRDVKEIEEELIKENLWKPKSNCGVPKGPE